MKETDTRADVKAFLAMLEHTPMHAIETLGAVGARALLEQVRAAQPEVTLDLAVVRDIACDGPGGTIPLRLYDRRLTREPGPVVVYFHGGGFVLGDLDSHHAICGAIAGAVDLPVVAVAYRLAPEHPWPAAPDDCEAVVRWLGPASHDALGRSATSFVLAGDSAGANLAAVTANSLARDPAAVPVVAQCLFYPTTGDARPTGSRTRYATGYFLSDGSLDWFYRSYAGAEGDPRFDLFAGDLAKLPPTLLVTAGCDPLRDEGRDYAAALIRSGVDVVFQEAVGNIHGFLGFTREIPSSQKDLDRALTAFRWLWRQTSDGSGNPAIPSS